MLDNLRVYLSVHPETPDIASISQEVFKLTSAIDNDDVSAIEATEGTLKQQMEAVPGWPDFVRSRAEEKRQAEIKALGEAVCLASKNQRKREDTNEFYDRMIETAAIAAAACESVLRQRDMNGKTFYEPN